MKVALIGYGVENQAAFSYWQKQGADITICDQNEGLDIPEGTSAQLGSNYLDNLDRFDVVVRTVGMHPQIILDQNPDIKNNITTAVNIFFEACKTPIIGITGTKGKGTTSSLIQRILETASVPSILAGNIGVPMLDILDQAQACQYVVLELSSFQLYDLKHSPSRAVCLMVVPEHLDWHTDIEDYKNAKKKMFQHQKSDDVAIYNAFYDDSVEIASASPAETKLKYGVPNNGEDTYGCVAYEKDGALWYNGQEIMKTSEIKLLGRHNLENACAAIAATWDLVGDDKSVISRALSSFSGLPYRLELIREVNGVKYYNDSFSTTPETAIAALRSFEEPIIAILGGSDKGIPLEPLADEVVARKVKHVLTIGERGPVIADMLRDRGYNAITDEELYSMEDIVKVAHSTAEPGDIVLLSTGCASFGMFKNYKDRGNQFNQSVQALA